MPYRIKVTVKERKENFFVKVDSFEGDIDKVLSLLMVKYSSSNKGLFDRLYKALEISGDDFISLVDKWHKNRKS